MALIKKTVDHSAGAVEPQRQAESANKNRDVARRFTWEIASISVHLEELRYFWAKGLGISGPQWMILIAVAELDQGEGIPVNAVSKMLHVDSSFVTTQSKLLEKKGFLRRKPSLDDARVELMSLPDKSYKQIAVFAAQQDKLNEFIFEEFGDRELPAFPEKLKKLTSRLE